LAELKKEQANQLYSAKQYKHALIGYNKAIGEYYNEALSIIKKLCYINLVPLIQNYALTLLDIIITDVLVLSCYLSSEMPLKMQKNASN
jgi:hypothetical protein